MTNHRDFTYEEDLTTTTGSSGVDVSKLGAVTFSGDAADEYLVIVNCAVGNLSAQECLVSVIGDYWEYNIAPVQTTDYWSVPMVFPYETSGFDFGVNINVNPASGRATIRDASAVAFTITEQDSVVVGNGSTSSTTYVAIVTNTFDVEPGDYIVIAGCQAMKNNTGNSYVKIVVDGTDYTEQFIDSLSTSGGVPWFHLSKINFTSRASKTFEIQAKVETSGSVTISPACVAVMRADLFPAYFFGETRAAVNTNTVDPTFTTAMTLTALTQAQSFVALSASLSRQTVASKQLNTRTRLDSSSTFQTDKNENTAASIEYTHSSLSSFTPSAASHSVTIEGARSSTGGGSGSMSMNENSILLLQMEDNATVWIKGTTDIFGLTDIAKN